MPQVPVADASQFETPKGYATGTYSPNGVSYFPWDLGELNPELSYTASVRLYSQMRTDATITAVTRAIHLTLQKLDWRLDPGGAPDDFVAAIAQDLGLPILGAEQSSTKAAATVDFKTHLAEALECTTYGHMPFEITVKPEGGMYRLARLDVRHPATITRLWTDPQGKLLNVFQSGAGEIPGDRMCWYRIGGIGAVPQGVSMLRSAYKPWKLKDNADRLLQMAIQRNSLGVPTFEMPPGATEDEINAALALAQSYRSSDFAAVATPAGAKLRLVGVEGSLVETLPAIQSYKSEITQAALAGFFDLGSSSKGSHSLGEVLIDLFRDSCQAIGNGMGGQFTTQVLKRLAEWSYGPGAVYPRLVPGIIGDDDNLAPAAIATLVAAGLLTADTGLEVHLRQQYGLPEMDDSTEHTGVPTGTSAVTSPEPLADTPGAANFARGTDPHVEPPVGGHPRRRYY